ncbi:hypothetical protein A3F03_01190 [Candidatus Roizmanbacteria bacterium RIFCSPHIGHO2_12_FULL_41_11]|uniref:Uncharacterized protein n=1 Tax=Candidatus Roizmanbacteria bacterium RIFCSPHIGHO2_12_FULL_41_11 TaxID=1802052 RepID=A0A1F7I0B0_9BACT|nr:MAG: hypothetical protein A3F03_01190 [Candidatus Roizmanbacteria bacterium RIFCSPHIGHO2_12_FULL_41_11]
MLKKNIFRPILTKGLAFFILAIIFGLSVHGAFAQNNSIQVNSGQLGFRIPNLADVLTFFIRFFFVLGGIMALLYLLLGAFAWITSAGDKEAVTAARDKITNAIIGVILIVAVLAVIVTLEQIVFQKKICFGISCPATIPGLLSTCTPNPALTSTCCTSGFSGYRPDADNSTSHLTNTYQCCTASGLNPIDSNVCKDRVGGSAQ